MGRVDDGHSTTIEFSAAASIMGIVLWEKSVTPPGIDGGGENDTTTMRNLIWRTKSPKTLKTMTEFSFTAAYDPACYDEILELLQVNNQVTINFADGSSLTFWGWLDKFTPGEVVEGEQPEADVVIIPSNQNDSGVEVAPAYSAS